MCIDSMPVDPPRVRYRRARLQSRFEFCTLFFPSGILLLRLSIECGAGVFDLLDFGFMGALGFFHRGFGIRDCQVALLALFFQHGQFLLALSFAPLLFSLERNSCRDGSSVIGLWGTWVFSRGHCFDRCLLGGALAEVSW